MKIVRNKVNVTTECCGLMNLVWLGFRFDEVSRTYPGLDSTCSYFNHRQIVFISHDQDNNNKITAKCDNIKVQLTLAIM